MSHIAIPLNFREDLIGSLSQIQQVLYLKHLYKWIQTPESKIHYNIKSKSFSINKITKNITTFESNTNSGIL